MCCSMACFCVLTCVCVRSWALLSMCLCVVCDLLCDVVWLGCCVVWVFVCLSVPRLKNVLVCFVRGLLCDVARMVVIVFCCVFARVCFNACVRADVIDCVMLYGYVCVFVFVCVCV